MLRELRIENLLLIERAELRFEAGLNAITGETGAGKTVLAHSLDLLLGGKPRSGIVRPGAGEAWVEGVFDLDPRLREEPELAELLERLPQDAEEVVLARRVSAAGRSSAFLAGRAATAPDLRALGTRLLAFYGQHESRKLTVASVQSEILDSYAGPEHLELREGYAAAHRRVLASERELAALRERDGARERDLDLLRFELAEIEELGPDAGEYDDLVAERNRLRGVEGLREGVAAAVAALAGDGDESGGAAGLAAVAEDALARAGETDRELGALAERAGSLAVESSELASDLRRALEGLEADPERLEVVETRLDGLDRLLRKHGGSVETVLEHARACAAEIERLDRAEERLTELEGELARNVSAREKAAAKLSKSRAQAAPGLERDVAAELSELAMDGARLEVGLEPHPDGFGPGGAELVELRVATNPGLPLAPLGETASGGELSRVMLALTGVGGMGGGAAVETIVFDEIDAGIGGKVARRVGERLRALGAGRQLICITHLPQVASLAAVHFRVEKSAAGDGTVARVERVGGDELVAEIVRMLGADRADAAANEHARELLAA